MYNFKSIEINQLILDVQNSRFNEYVDGQREAIKIMLETQGHKLIKLAKDIAENGIDPSERLIVIESDDDDSYIVKEGNRRLSALKLIENPSLAQNKSMEIAFDKIKKSRKIITKSVDCVVYNSDDYNHWINLKHTGQNEGASRVGWTTPEQLRFMSRNGKESYANQLYSFIELFPDFYSEILKEKNKVKITNLDRLLGDPHFRKSLNLSGEEKLLYCSQPLERFMEQYKRVLSAMVLTDDKGKPDFTVNRIRSKDDRTNFIADLRLTSYSPKIDQEWRLLEPLAHKNVMVNGGGVIGGAQEEAASVTNSGDNLDKSGKVVDDIEVLKDDLGALNDVKSSSETAVLKNNPPANINRNHVIPMNVTIKFSKDNIRCHRIFGELKRMSHSDYQNSIAVMLRVFIELSLNTYIDNFKIIYFDKKNPSRNPGLHDKVVLVATDLEAKKLLTGSKKSAVLSYSKQATSASSSLQQYVHNANLIPAREFVNTEWDNFQPLVLSIWKSLE